MTFRLLKIIYISLIEWIKVSGEKHISTLNLIKGNNVYGEKLVKYNGEEYRIWDPFRSKSACSLKKGLRQLPLLSQRYKGIVFRGFYWYYGEPHF